MKNEGQVNISPELKQIFCCLWSVSESWSSKEIFIKIFNLEIAAIFSKCRVGTYMNRKGWVSEWIKFDNLKWVIQIHNCLVLSMFSVFIKNPIFFSYDRYRKEYPTKGIIKSFDQHFQKATKYKDLWGRVKSNNRNVVWHLLQTMVGFHFQSTDCSAWLVMSSDGTIDPLICPHCIFDPDSWSITNQSHQLMGE